MVAVLRDSELRGLRVDVCEPLCMVVCVQDHVGGACLDHIAVPLQGVDRAADSPAWDGQGVAGDQI